MTKTEYLFGFPKQKYYGVMFPQLGYDRLSDAQTLRNKLQARVTYDPTKQTKFQEWLDARIRKIDDAIKTWKKIMEIEE